MHCNCQGPQNGDKLCPCMMAQAGTCPDPRSKMPDETTQENLARRLEEYMEHAYKCKSFSDFEFYKQLLGYIDES